MKKVLYYDCFAGISGDMHLAAMLNLGVPYDYLLANLKKLNLNNYELQITTDSRKGISGTKATVVLKQPEHKHRNLKDITNIINSSNLFDEVKKLSLKIFTKIAQAEAIIHNKNIEDIHFHEIGAIDSIVDIIGAAICIDYLKPDIIYCSTIELGGGTVTMQHGTYPVPAPATIEILKNIPIKTGGAQYEMTTPTGAAILASTVSKFTDNINNLSIQKIGYGIGHRDTSIPNVLRIYFGEINELNYDNIPDEETAILLECNIDDMNPELYEHVIEKLFEQGAQDVFITPIIMKKSRPANMLSVIAAPVLIDKLKNIIFCNTTTLGIRQLPLKKTMLKRTITTINTKYGAVQVKKSYYNNQLVHSKPEYDDCKKIAEQHNISIQQIINAVNSSIVE